MGEMDIAVEADGGVESDDPQTNGDGPASSDPSGGVIATTFADVEEAKPLAGGVLHRMPPLMVFGAGSVVGAIATTLIVSAYFLL